MIMRGVTLKTPLRELKGVGDVLARGLGKLGLTTVHDLLEYYPRRWDDYSFVEKISDIRPGLVTIAGRVEHIEYRRSFKDKRLSITEAIIADKSGTIRAIWFNQPFVKTQLQKGQEYVFRGKFEFRNNHLSLHGPTYTKGSAAAEAHVVPIYKENSAITSKILSRLVRQVIHLADTLEDVLPPEILESEGLVSYGQAVRILHAPGSISELNSAKKRIAFTELFMLIASALVLKQDIKLDSAPVVTFNAEAAEAYIQALPFKLTNGQKKAAWAVLQDIAEETPMNRLVEGDVGSGKTVVAFMAAYMAIKQGYQVAMMVPTEILARQHYASACRVLEKLGVKIGLLIGSLKASEKNFLKQDIMSGEFDLVIGTHALLDEAVGFKNLALVVIDEQHRFGVNQRRQLKARSEKMPHVLTMTATPIPRSLALVVYGELDISVIDEMPVGRKPVVTKLITEGERKEMEQSVDQLIGRGHQAFVICPLIEELDNTGVKSVQQEFERLSKGAFAHRTIELLHGKLKSQEKEHIMNQFKLGRIDILVATTVVEVGVDVPNANVMIIENAERFGLAALHQLRGRVGRGSQQAHCYLLSDTDNPLTAKRLRALERTTDGFRLSQIDLEMRGPGEIYGARQHGLLDLRMANVMDAKLVSHVRSVAEAFLATGNVLEYPHMLKRLNQLKAMTTLD